MQVKSMRKFLVIPKVDCSARSLAMPAGSIVCARTWAPANSTSASPGGLFAFRQVLVRNRRLRRLAGPIHVNNPPSCSVIPQLNAVDASLKRLFVRFVPRFVCAEDLRDAAERFHLAGNFPLVERVFLEIFAATVDVALHAHGFVSERAILFLERSDQLRFGNKQSAKAVPVPV